MKKIYLLVLFIMIFVMGYETVRSFCFSPDKIAVDLTADSGITPPEFKGGRAAFLNYRNNNLKYPVDAYMKKIEGVVLVSCTIDVDGTVKNPIIVNSPDSRLNEEALRLVASTNGLWIPARRDSVNIAHEKSVPVPFSLTKAGVVELPNKKGKKEILLYIMLSLSLVGLLYYTTVKFFREL